MGARTEESIKIIKPSEETLNRGPVETFKVRLISKS